MRDRTTFDLGSRIDTDRSDIRAALVAHVADDGEMTRDEAFARLARQKDSRIIEPPIQELECYPGAEDGSYSLETAEEITAARLLPMLSRPKQSVGADDATLDDVIERCSRAAIP